STRCSPDGAPRSSAASKRGASLQTAAWCSPTSSCRGSRARSSSAVLPAAPSLSGAPLTPLSTLSITTPPSVGRLLAPSAVPRGPLAPRDRDRGFSAGRSGGQRRAGHEAAPDGFHLFDTGERAAAGIGQPSADGLP